MYHDISQSRSLAISPRLERVGTVFDMEPLEKLTSRHLTPVFELQHVDVQVFVREHEPLTARFDAVGTQSGAQATDGLVERPARIGCGLVCPQETDQMAPGSGVVGR